MVFTVGNSGDYPQDKPIVTVVLFNSSLILSQMALYITQHAKVVNQTISSTQIFPG